jgi:alpha-glucosidase
VVRSGRAYYSVTRDDRILLDDSLLGLLFQEREPLNRGFTVLRVTERQIDETWEPVWGTDASVQNRCHEVTLTLVKGSGLTMDVILRAYDDGVAFRYSIPDQDGFRSFELISEETEFCLTGDHTTWWIPADFDSYEHLYRETRLAEVEAVATPVTMRTEEDIYLSIHEANLTDYAGMTLRKTPVGSTLVCDLVPWPDGIKVRGDAPLVTPWRTIQIADTPGGLVESHIMENLNEPCAIKDCSWIQPMKYVGIWWGMHIGKDTWHQGERHGATSVNTRAMIDFAAHRTPRDRRGHSNIRGARRRGVRPLRTTGDTRGEDRLRWRHIPPRALSSWAVDGASLQEHRREGRTAPYNARRSRADQADWA